MHTDQPSAQNKQPGPPVFQILLVSLTAVLLMALAARFTIDIQDTLTRESGILAE